MDWSSAFWGFLGGILGAVATNAAGTYFGESWTDRRRKKESNENTPFTFNEVRQRHSALFAESAGDLNDSANEHSRMAYIVPRGASVRGNIGERILAYAPEDHADLHSQFRVLENHGYVVDETVGKNGVPRYRLTEEFVRLIKK